jgi:cell division protein FtsL
VNNQNNWEDARISVDGNTIHLEKIVKDLEKKVGRNETIGWVGILIAVVLSIPIVFTQFAYNEIKDQNQEIKDQNQEIKDQNQEIKELANLLREQNEDLVNSNKELTERIHQVELKNK